MKKSELIAKIATKLKDSETHKTLADAILNTAGVTISETSELSKWDRVAEGLNTLEYPELAQAMFDCAMHYNDEKLLEQANNILEIDQPRIGEITRRDIAKAIGSDLCQSDERLIEICTKHQLNSAEQVLNAFFGGRDFISEVRQHMISFPEDWDVEHLFKQMEVLTCSNYRFSRLLEDIVHPLTYRGEEQVNLINALNPILNLDGYVLRQVAEESGHPVYSVEQNSDGVKGTVKNLVFASNGPKPKIGFSDAINNDIAILTNKESCLVYDRPLLPRGLLWNDLIEWWSELEPDTAPEFAKALGKRLSESLSSEAEKNIFRQYFHLFKEKLGDNLPALVPQVYLHYDPDIFRNLKGRESFPRQRMDFLLLFPNAKRVIIEVDGKHHFSANDAPCLKTYAEMVATDRDLRLLEYEVYRFGANELLGKGSKGRIEQFFEKLFLKHSIAK